MEEEFQKRFKKLNPKQKEAVETVYGPVMVIAGPGTGKTTVLTLRIANILRLTGALPNEILAITFTDSGVKAMREKLREVIGDASFKVHIHTFHSFANKMRGEFPECFKHIGERVLSAEIDQVEIIEEILEKENFKEFRLSEFGLSIKFILKRISELKRELISSEILSSLLKKEREKFEEERQNVSKMTKTLETSFASKEKYFVRMEEFVKVFDLYERGLKEKGLYDFDDIILHFIEALKENDDMLFEMREKYQYILADEHQDANAAQNCILESFHDESLPEEPNIFVVGDDKQSIFRFQGANLNNFFAFKDKFKTAKKIDLEDNYRSHAGILDASYSMISSDGRAHTKLKANTSFEVRPLEILEFQNEREECIGIALMIEKSLKEDQERNIAVLARNNSALFTLAQFLNAKGVSYVLKGEVSLFETLEYKKLHTLFLALQNPLRGGELLEVLFFGFFDIDLKDILILQDEALKVRKSFGEVFLGNLGSFTFESKEKIKSLQKKIKELFTLSKTESLLEFLKSVKESVILSDKSELFEVLKALFLEAEHVVMRHRNARLQEFLHHLALIEKHKLSPLSEMVEGSSQVTLMTIHRSKGLEFDEVYIMQVNSKHFDKETGGRDLLKIPQIGVSKELEEERRLLYVAITRAKRHAVLTFSLKARSGGNLAPSVLLDEIDPQFVFRKKGPISESVNLIDVPKTPRVDFSLLRKRFLEKNFSVSALNNFVECPYKYLFRNLLQIPDIKDFSALLGTLCHEVLKRFHLEAKKKRIFETEELKEIISAEAEKLPFTEKDLSRALEKAEEYILAYVKEFEVFTDEEVFVEESLSFPFTFDVGGESIVITINGKIDLAVETSQSVTVIDFKTKQRMTSNAIKGLTSDSTGNEYRQLQFYKFLWKEAKEEDKVSLAILTFLSPKLGKISSEKFALSIDDLVEIRNLTEKVLREIYTGEFLKRKCDDDSCEFCKKGLLL